jgi:Mg-chelatase subunit ChlD
MQFSNPLALLLLLVLPLLVWLGWPARGYNRQREILSLVLRLVICLALILGIAGLEIRNWGEGNPLAVVFLLDVSDSMPDTAIQAGITYIGQSLESMAPEDQAALVVFGQEALVERPMTSSKELSTLTSIPVTTQTNLAQAVHLGLALFPPGKARRMVILSDGVITAGNSSDAVKIAAAAGVEVIVLPFIVEPASEILVNSVQAPVNLHQGDQFDLDITLAASQSGSTRIRVLADDQVVYEAQQEVEKGQQTFSLPLSADQSGFTTYQVQIEPEDDQFYQNNSLSGFSQISGPPRILLVAPPAGSRQNIFGETRPDESSALRMTLETAGFEIEEVPPILLPSELPALATYASIVLVDVPARDLTGGQMTSLQSYVRDLGGGLVTVGGPTSYGVGGYFRTPLEETLPVDMQIKDEQRRPTLAIVFIIDHSGSMSETSGGPTKLELAKEAVIRSIELLNPKDQIGIITFDDSASWVVEMQEVEDGGSIKNKVASIGIGGGTDIMAGLRAMAEVLPEVEAGARHVILLTDGGADPTGIPELVEQLFLQEGITLSTIGVGQDAAPFLPQLAEVGGGRYHFAADPSTIPNIYTEETSLATRAYIIEEQFTPALLSSSPIMDGITEMPQLLGYVGTSSKETAQVILVTHKNDPLLASWRYGLGKAIAFTSDATGRWAQAWLNWDGFGTFWAQVVRSSFSDDLSAGLDIRVDMVGDKAHITIDAAAYPGSDETNGDPYLNNYSMQVNIVNPDRSLQLIDLGQVAPGKYEGWFSPDEQGIYLLRVSGQPPTPGEPVIGETAGWAMDYSPEYRQLDSDPDALVRLAAQAGGRLASDNPGETFTHTLIAPGVYQAAWPYLLALAAILLPFDIGVRRLIFTRSDFQRMMQTLYRVTHRPEAQQEVSQPEAIRSLFKAKHSAGERMLARSDPPQTLPPERNAPIIPEETQTRLPTHTEASQQSNTELSPAKPEPQSPSSSVSTLLAKKRSRQEPDEDSEGQTS